MNDAPSPRFLTRPDGTKIAYHALAGKAPGVIFVPGMMSNMSGTKATALEAHCRETGRAYVRFDYSGHGESSGKFTDCTIGDWAGDALAVLDEVAEGPQILVGSSMGGWTALLLARDRPERVAWLIGVAAAPDFTEDMIWTLFSDEQKAELREKGVLYMPTEYGDEDYAITLAMIEEGRNHLVLKEPLAIDCPVRLLQGMADVGVPWKVSLNIVEKLTGKDVTVTLVKAGGHRMSSPDDIRWLCATVEDLCRST